MKSTIYTILVGIVMGMVIFYAEKSTRLAHEITTLEAMLDDCRAVIAEQTNHIPTIKELLSKLRRADYYKGNDVWGKNATEALKRHSFNEYALVYYDPNMYEAKL